MAKKRRALRGKSQKAKFGRVLSEFKKGSLRSGSGKRVTSQKQALAIAFSEGRTVKRKKKKGRRRKR